MRRTIAAIQSTILACPLISNDAKHYTLDLSPGKVVCDAPMESASRSPRINATFSYRLN
jgi:hypothetical protein